jgi:transducin (beta)-like 1
MFGIPSAMSVSMNEINFLVWRYMQENGFPHSAFIFGTEALASSTNIPGALVPPGARISLLQKSLIYLRIEKTIHQARGSPNSRASGDLERIVSAFPDAAPDSAISAGVTPIPLNSPNLIQLQSSEPSPLVSLAWSPDGEKLVSLHANGCGFIWGDRCQTQVPIGSPGLAITRYAQSVAWDSRSELIAVCGDRQTDVYDLKGAIAFSIPIVATVVAFHPAGPLVVACSRANFAVSLWLAQNGAAVQTHRSEIHREPIVTISWKNGATFATGSLDKCIGLFSSGVGTALRGHTLSVTAVTFFDDSLLASASEDGSIIVWSDGHQRRLLKGHAGGVLCLAWQPGDASLLASGSADGTVKIWDVSTGDVAVTLARHTKGVTAIGFHRDGALLATGGADGIVGLWDWQNARMVAAFAGEAPIVSVAFEPTGKMIAVCNESPIATVFSLEEYL